MSAVPGPIAAVGLHVVRQPGDGTGPPAVVVHGTMDRSSSFGRVARQLGETALVRYDRRGYGRSVDAGVATLDEHVDDLVALLDEEPAALFGHSLGGVIALIAASRRPDLVTAVLSYETPTPWTEWWPARRRPAPRAAGDPADEAEQFMRRTVGDDIWERLPARTRADRRAEGGALRSDLAGMADGRAPFDPAAITVPVISATGDQTTWWHRRAAEELAASLPAGELEVVEGAGHGVHLTHPAATADLVRRVRAAGRAEDRS